MSARKPADAKAFRRGNSAIFPTALVDVAEPCPTGLCPWRPDWKTGPVLAADLWVYKDGI